MRDLEEMLQSSILSCDLLSLQVEEYSPPPFTPKLDNNQLDTSKVRHALPRNRYSTQRICSSQRNV